MNRIEKAIEKLQKDFLTIKNADNFEDWEEFGIIIRDGIQVVNAAVDKQAELNNRNDVIREYRRISSEEIIGEIRRIDDGIKLIMNKNLPKRDKDGKSSYDKNFFRDSIEPQLQKFIEQEEIFFASPVIIDIRSYYKSKAEMLDYDNIDIKPVIDLISAYCLPDDNPAHYDLMLHSEVGEKRKTVIFIKQKGEKTI